MTARGLGGVLLALVVGASVGGGAAYAFRPDPDASGTPEPVPADSPSVPTDDPYAPDISWPPLGRIVDFDTYRIGSGPSFETWEFAVPDGWVAYNVTQDGDFRIAPGAVERHTEVRFRPEGEPLEGGFSLRVKAIDNHATTFDEVADKVTDFERLYEDVDLLEQTDSTVYVTFRTELEERLRYNFFGWFAAPGSDQATLEMSIAGRSVDEAGMQELFDRFVEEARPVDE